MQITRTKKALVAVIALVLVGIFVAVAAVYLPSAENSSAFKDNTVADSGSGADAVSTVSASSTAPSEDGTVPDGYQPSGTGISDIATARGDLDGEYYLTQDITITSLAVADNADDVNVFTGVFDGNGKTITIDATSSADISNGSKGGLFAILQGTVKNCIIEVNNFQAKFNNGSSWANAGIIAGAGGGGNTLVENVKIILKHSPDNMSNGADNAYISQYVESAAKGASMRLGGVFGNVIGNVTINDTTVDNQTTGNYGFSSKDWRASGSWSISGNNNSNGYSYIGGFFGNIQSGNISANRLTLAGTSSSKIHAYSESTENYRFNRAFIGGILGYADVGKIDINGLIITYPMNNNFGYTNGNYDCASGIIVGYADDGNAGSVQNAYILSGVESAYNQSNGAGLTVNYNTFASGITPVFVDTSEIAFNGFTKQAPSNASAIVAEITHGGTKQNVMQALIATNESEAGQSVWLTVPYVNATSTAAINLAASYATGSTIALSSDLIFSSGEGIYMASREYNGENVSASIVLGDGKTDLYYSEANANKHVGTHTLTSNIASASGYAYIDYAGTKYVYNTANKTIYTPQEVAGALFDVTKALSVEITPRAITVGKASGNITYGDTVETVQLNNIPEATSGSLVGGEYVESCTISDYVQFEINAGSEDAFTYTAVVIKDASGADVTANYNVTYGAGTAVVKQKTIAGALSVADLVYANAEKVAVFTAEEGMGLFNDDAVEITYSGDRQNVTETGFTATATVPKYDDSNSNYTFESGASISETFKITPYEVAITVNDEATTEYEYSGVVPNSVLLTLFNAPEGLAGETLFLNFTATMNGEDATVQYAGIYKVTATLPESYMNEEGETVSQANYTAASCDATITIKAKEINVSLSDVENSKTYDGAVVGDDYLQTMFVVDGEVAEGHVAELEITVAEGEIKNAGVYNISVALPSHYDIMYAISATSTTQTTYTVGQVVIDGEISAPEDSVYDGSEKFATFVFAEGCEMVGSDEIILTYATQGGQGVTQVVSAGTYTVSAALPAFAAGKSNYKWASDEIATKDIVISKAPVTITANSATAEKQFDGVAFDDYASLFTAPKAVDGNTDLVLSYSVGGAAETIVNVGEYTVTATLADNGTNANYEAAEAVVTYTVTPVTVEIIWSENNYAYTGDVQTVSAKYAAVGGEEVDLAVSFGDGVEFRNAGDYLATASFAEGDNEYGNYVLPEVATNTYNIKKADSVIDTENVVKTYTYTGELQTIDSGATLNHSEAELVYSNNTFTTVAEGNGMEVVISVADTANYNGASTTVQITVNKATPAFTVTVEPTEGLFTSSEMPSITADFGENPVVEGVIVWDTDELTAGANAYGWTFTPVDTANYNVVTGSETLDVAAVEMTGIEIKTQPSKVTYEYGDKFDKTGMIVEAVYNDGSREIVEDYTVADAYLTSLGENQIEVTYNEMTATVTVTVEAKEFAIAYSDLTVVAGSEDFVLAIIEASIVGTEGNTVNVAGNDYTYSVAVAYTGAQYDAAAEVGTEYPLTVTVTVTDLDAQYYIGTYEATLRVIATSMEGSWTSESVIAEYDGTAHAAEFNKTVGGEFEIQYAVSGTDVWSTEVPVNAGEYVAKVVSLDEGYSADRLPTATVTINKKSVEITAVSVTVSDGYDGTEFTDYASLFNATNGVNDEGALELAFTVTKDGEPAEILGAGTYTVTATLANVDGNYTATACEVTYTVAPAEITVNWTGSDSVVYSGEAYEPTIEATGLFGDDKISVMYAANDGSALTDGKAINAGNYTATAVLPSDNYVFAAETATTFGFTIEKVRMSFSALLDGNKKYVEYGDTYEPSVDDFFSTSVENSDKFEFYIKWSKEFDLTGIATANAGTEYDAAVAGVVRYSGGEDIAEADYSNFELTGDIADIVVYVEVIAKKINVTATDASATYDGEKVSVDELLAMFGLGGIDANVTVDGGAYDFADIKNVGTYTVAVASANANYEFVGDTDATFTVDAATITDVVVTGYKGEYDKAAHGAVVSATAVTVDGSEATFVYATSEGGEYIADMPSFTNADTYTVYYKVSATNHSEAKGSFTVIITKAVVDLPVIEGKTYDGQTQTADVAENTLYNVVANNGGINAGDYDVMVELADKNNYAWAQDENGDGIVTLTFTVEKADYDMSGVTFANASKVYNGATQSVEISGVLPTGADGIKVTVSYSEGIKNVGSKVINATFATESDNYNAPEAMTATLTVTAKELTVTEVSAQNKTYDGTTAIEVNGSLAGVVGSDDVTLEISGTAVDKNVGTNKTVAVSASISGADSGNYTLAEVDDVTVTITAKAVNVVWGELTLEYDGTAKAPTATADTGIDGESVTIAVSGAATEPGTYTATATTDNGNYTLTNASVEYEIVKTTVAAQFTVGYGVITVIVDGDNDVEYSVDGGDWATLPEDGKISVNLEASWTIRLRYVGETAEVEHVVYTSAGNVLILLEENLDSDALLNKDVIDTAKSWLATAVGDKTEAQAKLTEAENAYNAAKDALADSVENAFKATANITDRAVAATVAIATAVTGLGLAAGAIAIRRKGGKKNEK